MSIIVDDDLLSGGPFDLTSAPEILYKFLPCKKDRIDALTTGQAWFASPKEWPDKSDFRFSFDDEGSIRSLREKGGEITLGLINGWLSNMRGDGRFSIALEKISTGDLNALLSKTVRDDGSYDKVKLLEFLVSKAGPYWGDKFYKQVSKLTDKALALLIEKEDYFLKPLEQLITMREQYCFLCLTESIENPPMWDRYAQEGGFAIGYSIDKVKFNKTGPWVLGRIIYGQKPGFNLGDFLADYYMYYCKSATDSFVRAFAKDQTTSFFTKSPYYEYEKEWRVMVKGENGHLEPFDLAFAIYFDESIADCLKKRLCSIAREKKLEVYERRFDCVHNVYYFAAVNQE